MRTTKKQYRSVSSAPTVEVEPLSKEELHREKTVREPLAKRLQRRRELVANDNLGRARRQKTTLRGAARPFGQKVVIFLLWFTIVLSATLICATLVLDTQLSFLANLGFSITLACVASCIPVVDTAAKVFAMALSTALICLFSWFTTAP